MGGWREQRDDGGVVIDVGSNEIVADGLSMPHSPRLHDGKLWLHNSGTGHFGFVDVETGHFEAVAFCPGYLRGLDFIGDYAIAGISKPRDKNFSGLQLDQNIENANSTSRCAILVIDTRSGDTVHWMQIEGVISEVYDVCVMPSVTRPMSIGFRSDEIRRILSIDKVEDLKIPGSADF